MMTKDDAVGLLSLVPIEKCPSCSGKHELPINTYSRQEPWTHWFICPDSGDPVNLTLLLDDKEPLQLHGELMQHIVKAHHSGEYFVAVFHWDKDAPRGEQCPKWFINQHLPHIEFGGCLDWLKGELAKIVGPKDVPAIQIADRQDLERLPFNLFGDHKKNGE